MALRRRGHELPEGTEVRDPEDYSSGRLFLQSARRVQSEFEPTETDKLAVARICRMVQGMPLGVELASAWVNTLSCEEIAEEIGKSLSFLETSMRDVPERHRSIAAVFDPSWNLLSDSERMVLRKMAVFPGGFCRHTVEAVIGGSLMHLSSLVDKSLLRRAATTGRYEMLEILRQRAGEKLDETAGERDAALRSLSSYFAAFLHDREEALAGVAQAEALEAISEDFENIRVAWDWAVETRAVADLSMSLPALADFYEMRGRYQEGEDALGRAARCLEDAEGPWSGAEDRDLLLARTTSRQGGLSFRLGRSDYARELLESSVATFRTSDAREELAFALMQLGGVVRRLGNYQQAKDYLEESSEIGRRMSDSTVAAQSLHNLGVIAFSTGEYEEARRLTEEGLSIRRQIGEQHGVAYSLNNLGNQLALLGDLQGAKKHYMESQEIFEKEANRWGVATCLDNIANVAHRLGDYEDASRMHESSLGMFQEIGDRWGAANSLIGWGDVACDLKLYDDAEGHLPEALSIAGRVPLSATRRCVVVGKDFSCPRPRSSYRR